MKTLALCTFFASFVTIGINTLTANADDLGNFNLKKDLVCINFDQPMYDKLGDFIARYEKIRANETINDQKLIKQVMVIKEMRPMLREVLAFKTTKNIVNDTERKNYIDRIQVIIQKCEELEVLRKEIL